MQNEELVYIVTHAKDNLELATIPFKLAVGAIAMDVIPSVFLQGEGVRLAVKGCFNEDNQQEKHLKELIDMYLAEGYKLYLCSPCLDHRNITEDDIIEGGVAVGAAKLTEKLLVAKNSVSY